MSDLGESLTTLRALRGELEQLPAPLGDRDRRPGGRRRLRRSIERGRDRAGELGDRLQGARPIAADLARLDEYLTLRSVRIEHLVEVRQPLVLISQIQRSGGTLLSQLLDGHSEFHAHPHELEVGDHKGAKWRDLPFRPDIGKGTPEEWWQQLSEAPARRHFHKGYSKSPREESRAEGETYAFLLPPGLQRAIFDACIARRPPRSRRDIFDCYMTSYFNAWLDNHNLYRGEKRWISAFVPGLVKSNGSLKKFFSRLYPEGRLVCIVRDPRSWCAARRGMREIRVKKAKDPSYGSIEQSVEKWIEGVEAIRSARERYGERVHVIAFEDLLGDTEPTMRALSDFLDVGFEETMLTPTFNCIPIKANSAFEVERHGILDEPTSRWREILSSAEIAYAEERAMPLYEETLGLRA